MSYQEIAKGTYRFTNSFDFAPGAILPCNHFAIIGSNKTMLVDTNAPDHATQTIQELGEVMNVEELDYIFLTHMDTEHMGGVKELLKVVPKARLVGNMTNMGKGTSLYGIAPERFAVVFPGQEIDLGDRKVLVEPSFIEDGHTNWLLDTKTGTYFTSDAFGAIQFGPMADYAETVPCEAMAAGFALWQAANFNTLPLLDVRRFQESVNGLRRRDIQQIASAHGPVIRQELDQAYDLMETMPTAEMTPPPPLPPIFQLN